MASSQQSKFIFDEIRRKWVRATPEECVRQNWLRTLIYKLNFPKQLIRVEVGLQELGYLGAGAPKRRADVICFGKGIHPEHSLYPLLLIECKEEEPDKKALDQLLGYNHFLKAFCVAVVGREGCIFGFNESTGYRFLSHIPSYAELLGALHASV